MVLMDVSKEKVLSVPNSQSYVDYGYYNKWAWLSHGKSFVITQHPNIERVNETRTRVIDAESLENILTLEDFPQDIQISLDLSKVIYTEEGWHDIYHPTHQNKLYYAELPRSRGIIRSSEVKENSRIIIDEEDETFKYQPEIREFKWASDNRHFYVRRGGNNAALFIVDTLTKSGLQIGMKKIPYTGSESVKTFIVRYGKYNEE